MPYPSLLHPEPLPLQQSTADLYFHRRHSNTVLSQSLGGSLGPGVHNVCLSPLSVSGRNGFDFNVNLPLLPSCLGFSFALGHGVSAHSHSSSYSLTGVSLPLDVGYLLTASPVKCSLCS